MVWSDKNFDSKFTDIATRKNRQSTKLGFTLAEGATHVNLPPTRIRFGFALAEVLIALGIIGIVAAMTIPTLMTKLKYKREAALLKENYSILQQMKLRANDEGAMSALPDSDNMQQLKNWFTTYMLPHVKVSKVCYGTKGCWSQNAKNSSGQIYVSSERCGNGDVSFILFNGTNVCLDDFTDSRFGVIGNGGTMIGLLVDVNGNAKPNKFGEDIFAFVFRDNELLSGGYDMTSEQVEQNCSEKCQNLFCGTYCMQKVVKSGYKLPVLNKN